MNKTINFKYILSFSTCMDDELLKQIGSVFGIVVAFISLNWFLSSIEGIQRWDFFLGNAALIVAAMFIYVFHEINKLKDRLKKNEK